jgi:hypothetical protein
MTNIGGCVSPKARPRVFGAVPKENIEVTAPTEPVEPSIEFRDELPLLGEESILNPAAEAYNTVTIQIPQSLWDVYDKVATAQSMSVEEVIQHRLAKCKNHNALRGLWFSDSEHSQLETLLKKCPLETASQVLTALKAASGIDLDGLKLSLTIPQRKVLAIRTKHGIDATKLFEAMIRREFQV